MNTVYQPITYTNYNSMVAYAIDYAVSMQKLSAEIGKQITDTENFINEMRNR
jgi:hypothetical protein